MARTGKQRSLTCTIDKFIAGVRQEGYPKIYQGRNEFTHNGSTYPAIDPMIMSVMPVADYEARLAAFKSYIQNIEIGLNFATDTIPSAEAYRINTTACPIG